MDSFSSSFLSSSSITPRDKYDIFLSFKTEDTGDDFTSHLYYALCQKKIKTFTYDNLAKGNEILPELFKVIEESKISIIIFSKNYASSEWCLNELVKIMKCKREKGQIVIPVYYHIDVTDVQHQIGSLKDAFVNHEKHFKHTNKLKKWKNALIKVSNLNGWDSSRIRPESQLVDKIAKDILEKLKDIKGQSQAIAKAQLR